jgi:hypothetical protein
MAFEDERQRLLVARREASEEVMVVRAVGAEEVQRRRGRFQRDDVGATDALRSFLADSSHAVTQPPPRACVVRILRRHEAR